MAGQDKTADEQQVVYDFTKHVLDKKYELSYAIDSKINAQITVNGIILAGAAFALSPGATGTRVCLAIAAGTAVMSLVLCLHVISVRFRGKRGAVASLRTVVGIETLDYEEYCRLLDAADTSALIRSNADQIIKLNSIVVEKGGVAGRSAILTSVSAVFLLVALGIRLVVGT